MTNYSSIQVLVIDDNEFIIDYVVTILQSMGVEKILSASNVNSASEKSIDESARTQ